MSFEDYTDAELEQIAGGAASSMSDAELESIANRQMPGAGESMLIGAGKTMTDIGRGAQKLYYGATGDEQALSELKAKSSQEQGYYDQLAQENPWSTMAGEMLPYLATMPLSGGLVTQAGIGATGEGLRYGENQAGQGVMGGVMSMGGYGVGRAAPRVMGAIRGVAQSNKAAIRALSEGQQRLVSRADELGYGLTPGQRLQSKPLQQIERSADSMPFTSGMTENMTKDNQVLLNRLALESIGETGDEIRGQLGKAADRIGAVYQNVAKDVPIVKLDAVKLKALTDEFSVAGEDAFERLVKKHPTLANGNVTGREWNIITTKLRKNIDQAFKNNTGADEDLIALRELFNEGLAKASPESTDALRVAGKQWRNLVALESPNVATKGNVNPVSLRNKLNKLDKGGFKRERVTSDYYDTVRIADELGGTGADSQTATRSWLADLATNPTGAAGGAALRVPYGKYLESGGSPVYANLLGAYPGAARAGATGAGVGRGIESVEFPEILE